MDLNALYEQNKNLVWFYVRKYLPMCESRPDIDPEDMFQAGFMGVMEAAKTFQPQKGSWVSWAGLYIRKNIRDLFGRTSKSYYTAILPDGSTERSRYVVGSLDAPKFDDEETTVIETVPDETPVDFDENLNSEEDARRIREAVDSLEDESQRKAVIERYFVGQTQKDIAEAWGVELKFIKNCISAAFRRLARDRRIVAIYRERNPLDEVTRFHAHKGLNAFFSSRSSLVEDAVIWRENQRNMARKGK